MSTKCSENRGVDKKTLKNPKNRVGKCSTWVNTGKNQGKCLFYPKIQQSLEK
jgi:hypothetical protein